MARRGRRRGRGGDAAIRVRPRRRRSVASSASNPTQPLGLGGRIRQPDVGADDRAERRRWRRPVGAAHVQPRRGVGRPAAQLAHQSCLADARFAAHRDGLRTVAAQRAAEQLAGDGQLALAADERGVLDRSRTRGRRRVIDVRHAGGVAASPEQATSTTLPTMCAPGSRSGWTSAQPVASDAFAVGSWATRWLARCTARSASSSCAGARTRSAGASPSSSRSCRRPLRTSRGSAHGPPSSTVPDPRDRRRRRRRARPR